MLYISLAYADPSWEERRAGGVGDYCETKKSDAEGALHSKWLYSAGRGHETCVFIIFIFGGDRTSTSVRLLGKLGRNLHGE